MAKQVYRPPQQSVVVAWGMALFWGFIWPWVLVVTHKGPVQRLMDSVIADVDAAARHIS